jgi:hypothetical protein
VPDNRHRHALGPRADPGQGRRRDHLPGASGAKLEQAEEASTATALAGSLGAFRNQANAKADKGLTAEQAAELKLLSLRL